ncbi:MAG: hypothetical protein A2X35_08600 [Elusimicrobia bacterium GWA2_61_42]|nr:MAG: hypothetical protein A2X35_08600 [Elusimicrobia bacterium GWA2_61_42]OGR77295.1 MAG: hypothetical protein A2X38_09150 [Elusimicrobia bacterium GWC2_61_25]
MKTLLLALIFCCCAATARAETAADCPKNSDACSGARKDLSPFLAASAAEPAPAPRPAALKKAPARVPAETLAPAAEVALSSAAAASVPGPVTFSNPLWLLFIGGGMAGLYFYLGGAAKKRRNK